MRLLRLLFALLVAVVVAVPAVAQESGPTTPPPEDDPTDDPTAATHPDLREAVAVAAVADGRLPLDLETYESCAVEDVELTFEAVPAEDFAVGGYVEPLVEPTTAEPDRATGIARCTRDAPAVAGFDAFLDDDGWTVHFVSPLVEQDEHADHGDDGARDDTTKLAESLATTEDLDTSDTLAEDGLQDGLAADATSSASASSSAAPPVPNWPSGMPTTAEPLSSSDPQDTCDPDAEPGALALADLLTRTYGTTRYGISRDCSVGGRSEHKEGRAVDWMIDAYDSGERAIGDTFTSWVLGDDPWGNDHAGMRRMGIMYMIWNRESIYSWAVDEGWRDYTGSSPHTDHVHFSMTWPGARCETSFWEATDCTGDVGGGGGGADTTTSPAVDDVLLFRNFDKRVVSLRVGPDGTPSIAWWTNWRRNWTDMVTADLDADGNADDVLLYNAETGDYSMQAFREGVAEGITHGTWWTGWRISAGDFDGNGIKDDLLLRRPDGRYNITHIDESGATDRQSTGHFTRDWTHAVGADLDGDGLDDDILLYDRASGRYSMQRVVGGEPVAHRSGRWWGGWDALVPGDHDGNGAHDDVFLFRNDSRRYNITHVRPDGATDRQDTGLWGRTWDSLTPADLDHDGSVNDVLMYNASTGAYSMQHITTGGPEGIHGSDWSSGWEFLPAGEFS